MLVKTFADTNIHVYAHSSSKDPKDIAKRHTAYLIAVFNYSVEVYQANFSYSSSIIS